MNIQTNDYITSNRKNLSNCFKKAFILIDSKE